MKKILALVPIFGNCWHVESFVPILRNWNENKYVDFCLVLDEGNIEKSTEFLATVDRSYTDKLTVSIRSMFELVGVLHHWLGPDLVNKFLKQYECSDRHHYLCDIKPMMYFVAWDLLSSPRFDSYEYIGFIDYDVVLDPNFDPLTIALEADVFNIKNHFGGPDGFFKVSNKVFNALDKVLSSEEYSIQRYYKEYGNTVRYDEYQFGHSFLNGMYTLFSTEYLTHMTGPKDRYILYHGETIDPETPYIIDGIRYNMAVLQTYMKRNRK